MLFPVLADLLPPLTPRLYVTKKSPVTSFPFLLSMSTNASPKPHEMLRCFLRKVSAPQSLL